MKNQDKGTVKLVAGIVFALIGVLGWLVPGFLTTTITMNGVYQAAASQALKVAVECGFMAMAAAYLSSYYFLRKRMN